MSKDRPSATTAPVEEVPITVEDLYQKTTLLSHAMRGVLDSVDNDHPFISWEDELLPVHDLVIEIHVGLRDLYLRECPTARKAAEESAKDYVASFASILGREKKSTEQGR